MVISPIHLLQTKPPTSGCYVKLHHHTEVDVMRRRDDLPEVLASQACLADPPTLWILVVRVDLLVLTALDSPESLLVLVLQTDPSFPAATDREGTRHHPGGDLWLGQRRRRCTNNKSTLETRLVCDTNSNPFIKNNPENRLQLIPLLFRSVIFNNGCNGDPQKVLLNTGREGTRHHPKVNLRSVQRRRRWANNKSTLETRPVFETGDVSSSTSHFLNVDLFLGQRTRPTIN